MEIDLWERHASWWQRNFTEGADAEYEEQILPLIERHARGARRVLDVGCGEGQVARRLTHMGIHVVGVDPVAAQIRLAYQRSKAARFARASAENIPFLDDSFDMVVVCLAFEHVDAFELALQEIARVLEPGGRLLLLLVHPLLQSPGSGWIELLDSKEHFWRIGAYLQDDVSIDEVAPGVNLTFAYRPLSRYIHEMGRCGLVVEDMVEPVPPQSILDETGGFADASTIPRLMLLCARNIGTGGSGGQDLAAEVQSEGY